VPENGGQKSSSILGLIILELLQVVRIPTVSVINVGLRRMFYTGICVFE
jgi:hypothetical protein